MQQFKHALFALAFLAILSSCGGDAVAPGEITAVDPCLDYVGLATPEELAATHRADAEAEQLVLEATGLFTAPQDLYERVSADLANIRTNYPDVSHITYGPSWDPQKIMFGLDDTGMADVLAGNYSAWDCPNDLYGVTPERIGSLNLFELKLASTVNIESLIDEYALFPNVRYVEPNIYYGDGPDICLFIDGDTLYYAFDDATGSDCLSGCSDHVFSSFASQPTGEVYPGMPLDWQVLTAMQDFCATRL